jgi:hypothetical protein
VRIGNAELKVRVPLSKGGRALGVRSGELGDLVYAIREVVDGTL